MLYRSFTRLLIGLIAAFSLAAPGIAGAQALNTIPYQQLPTYSGTPVTSGREPVSFIYVGTEQQIINLFISHGWNGADSISPSTLLRAYRAARDDAPYPTAPFSPAFINGQRQDLEFQLPTATIRVRHHTRIWVTGATTTDGRQVWVGTASFDNGIGTIGSTGLPVHTIDPDLDYERDFIVDSLGLSGAPYVQLNPAGGYTNTSGQATRTDGRAVVIDLDETSGNPDSPVAAPSRRVSNAETSSPDAPGARLQIEHSPSNFIAWWHYQVFGD
jgi:hypothetical protein